MAHAMFIYSFEEWWLRVSLDSQDAWKTKRGELDRLGIPLVDGIPYPLIVTKGLTEAERVACRLHLDKVEVRQTSKHPRIR